MDRLERDEKELENVILKDATRSFYGQINNHSRAAKEKMRFLRVAKLVSVKEMVEGQDRKEE